MFRAEEIGRLDRFYFNIILAECIIFHKHRASQPYHQHGRAGSLGQAVKSIKGYDVFQMNGRKRI